MLTLGVVVLGVTNRRRAQEFWCAALGYQVRDDGFGGWAGCWSRRLCIVDLGHEDI